MHDEAKQQADGQRRPADFSAGRILVVALKGWNDAGEAASTAVATLAEALDLRRQIATIDDERYFDYSINRPHTVRDADGERRIVWPRVVLSGPDAEQSEQLPEQQVGNLAADAQLQVTAAGGGKLLLLRGQEPTLGWRSFVSKVLDLAEDHEVTSLVLVGALLADVPHTRPINVFVSSEDEALREELSIGRSEYQGPTGVLSVLGQLAEERGIDSVSLWASVPHYASQPPSPKAQLALVDRLEELLDVSIPRTELIERAERWEEEVNAATDEDNEIAEYIGYLERAHDTVEAPEASGEAIAKEFERFLRQSGSGGPAGGAPWTGPIARYSGEGSARPERGDDEQDEDDEQAN